MEELYEGVKIRNGTMPAIRSIIYWAERYK